MIYSKSVYTIILVSGIPFGIANGQDRKAVQRKAEQPKHPAEAEILKLLPKRSEFADDIPIIQPKGENAKKKEMLIDVFVTAKTGT